jgi:hypothetical protein
MKEEDNAGLSGVIFMVDCRSNGSLHKQKAFIVVTGTL